MLGKKKLRSKTLLRAIRLQLRELTKARLNNLERLVEVEVRLVGKGLEEDLV